MRHSIQILLFFTTTLAMLFSCNEGENKATHEQSDSVTNTTNDSIPQTNCYLFTSGRDSYLLQLDRNYSGKMEFRNYEKDKSFGTVKGTQQNDIVKLWYDFHSEGMKSVMEIHLKKTGNDLMRGLGEVRVSNDTAYNADNSKIDYNNGQLFRKTDCNDLKFRY
jgi:hypothetical protein